MCCKHSEFSIHFVTRDGGYYAIHSLISWAQPSFGPKTLLPCWSHNFFFKLSKVLIKYRGPKSQAQKIPNQSVWNGTQSWVLNCPQVILMEVQEPCSRDLRSEIHLSSFTFPRVRQRRTFDFGALRRFVLLRRSIKWGLVRWLGQMESPGLTGRQLSWSRIQDRRVEVTKHHLQRSIYVTEKHTHDTCTHMYTNICTHIYIAYAHTLSWAAWHPANFSRHLSFLHHAHPYSG